MLPEVGGLEWLIIAIVALIVVGPKDLPVMMRRLGEFVAKLRTMASEFRASFDEMARQSELDDLRKEVEAMRRGQFLDMATQTEHIEAHSTIRDIEQSMADVGVSLHTPAYQYDPAAAPPPLEISEAPAAKPARKPRAAKPAAAKAKPAAAKAKPDAAKAKVAAEPAAKPPAARKPRPRKTAEAGS